MTKNLPPVYFYFPKKYRVAGLPDKAGIPWEGFYTNSVNWILQTYLYLKEAGFPCALIDTLPDSGVVISHRVDLPFEFKPNRSTLSVCVKSDYDWHYFSQLHVTQNPNDKYEGKGSSLWQSHYMTHWPEPGLIPRDLSRGDKFENICFFGITYNLAPELKQKQEDWQGKLKALSLNWRIMPGDKWHDYSEAGGNILFPYRDIFLHYRYLHDPEKRPKLTGRLIVVVRKSLWQRILCKMRSLKRTENEVVLL